VGEGLHYQHCLAGWGVRQDAAEERRGAAEDHHHQDGARELMCRSRGEGGNQDGAEVHHHRTVEVQGRTEQGCWGRVVQQCGQEGWVRLGEEEDHLERVRPAEGRVDEDQVRLLVGTGACQCHHHHRPRPLVLLG